MPDIVNPQITDSITQTNVKILGDAPGQAMAMMFQATSNALANAAHNSSLANSNVNTVLQATTTQGVALLYGVDTAAESVGITEILGANSPGYPTSR
jgi:hypothetical protein